MHQTRLELGKQLLLDLLQHVSGDLNDRGLHLLELIVALIGDDVKHALALLLPLLQNRDPVQQLAIRRLELPLQRFLDLLRQPLIV